MAIPTTVATEITPFVTSYKNKLKDNLESIDRKLSANGNLRSGVRIQKHKETFLESIPTLVGKIKDILFNAIKNDDNNYQPNGFSEVEQDIQSEINPQINSFKSGWEGIIKDFVKDRQIQEQLNTFDSELSTELQKLYVVYGREFDKL